MISAASFNFWRGANVFERLNEFHAMGKIFFSGFMDFSFSFIFMESILPVFSTCNNFFVFHFLFSAGGCETVKTMI